jgi:hypothetical protein
MLQNFISFKMIMCFYLSINVCCRVSVPSCSRIQHHKRCSKLLWNIFSILCTEITRPLSCQIVPQLFCIWLKAGHCLDRKMTVCPGWDVTGNHCRDRFQVSVCQTISGFRLIIVQNRKKLFTRLVLLNMAVFRNPKDLSIEKMYFHSIHSFIL